MEDVPTSTLFKRIVTPFVAAVLTVATWALFYFETPDAPLAVRGTTIVFGFGGSWLCLFALCGRELSENKNEGL
jgi:hypothetical protein